MAIQFNPAARHKIQPQPAIRFKGYDEDEDDDWGEKSTAGDPKKPGEKPPEKPSEKPPGLLGSLRNDPMIRQGWKIYNAMMGFMMLAVAAGFAYKHYNKPEVPPEPPAQTEQLTPPKHK